MGMKELQDVERRRILDKHKWIKDKQRFTTRNEKSSEKKIKWETQC